MRSHPVLAIIVVVLAVFVYGLFGGLEKRPPNYSEEEIVLTKREFLDYKFPDQYPNLRAFSDVAFRFRKPGYGIGFDGSVTDKNGVQYDVAEINVPNGTEEMVVVYRRGKTIDEPVNYVSHFIIEHKVEDELLRPRRTVEIDDGAIRFLSNGRMYKSHDPTTNHNDE